MAEGAVGVKIANMGVSTLQIPAGAQQYSVVLLKASGRGPFLLQERAKRYVYAGRLGLFGGGLNGGESPEACALREVEEETGLDLAPSEIHLFTRLLARDERDHLSFGHIYWADNLNDWRVQKALAHQYEEGRVLELSRRDIARYWERLTPTAAYSLSAYFDLEKTGALATERY